MTGPLSPPARTQPSFATGVIALYVAVLSVSVFVLTDPIYLAAACLGILVAVAGTGALRASRTLLGFGAASALVAVVVNPLFSHQGVTILIPVPLTLAGQRLDITAEAVAFGVAMGLRLFALIAAAAFWTAASDPDKSMRLMARLSFRSALLTSLGARLIPTLVSDTERVMDAQRSRGLRLDEGGRLERLRARAPVLDAAVLSSLERTTQLAESMESRGFGRGQRSRMRPEPWAPRDRLVALAVLALVGVCAAVALGPARYDFYPLLTSPLGAADLAFMPAYALLIALPGLLSWGWKRSLWLRSSL